MGKEKNKFVFYWPIRNDDHMACLEEIDRLKKEKESMFTSEKVKEILSSVIKSSNGLNLKSDEITGILRAVSMLLSETNEHTVPLTLEQEAVELLNNFVILSKHDAGEQNSKRRLNDYDHLVRRWVGILEYWKIMGKSKVFETLPLSIRSEAEKAWEKLKLTPEEINECKLALLEMDKDPTKSEMT